MMRYMICLLAALLLAGCGNENKVIEGANIPDAMKKEDLAGLPQPSGGFTLRIGDEVITADEVVKPLIKRAKPMAERMAYIDFYKQVKGELTQVVVSQAGNRLLLAQAKEKAGEQAQTMIDQAADTEVKKFVAGFRGDAARADQALQQMGIDREQYREHQKKMILTYSYMQDQMPEPQPVTYSELRGLYDRMKESFVSEGSVTFRLIEIDPAKFSTSDPNQDKTEAARQLAEQLKARIDDGADFAELAIAHSHGPRSEYGGLWGPYNPESFQGIYEGLGELAMAMKVGRIEGPIELNGHFFLIKLEQKQAAGHQTFEDVQPILEKKLKFERQQAAQKELWSRIVHEAASDSFDAFVNFCIQTLYVRAQEG